MIVNLFEKIIIIFLFLALLVGLIIWLQMHFAPAQNAVWLNNSGNAKPAAKINSTKIKLEIADTPQKRYQGLSHRSSLCPNCGMLFVWPVNGQPQTAPRAFVMRNMNFPLDIIWIANNKIIKIDENLPPEGARPQKIYVSGQAVNYVLEVNGGFCQRRQIKVGNKVKFLF